MENDKTIIDSICSLASGKYKNIIKDFPYELQTNRQPEYR